MDRVSTPLLLVVGAKGRQFADTMSFDEAPRRAGRPVTLISYPDQGHEITDAAIAEQHMRRAIEFLRAAPGREVR